MLSHGVDPKKFIFISAEPIRADYGAEPAMTELVSMIKDLRYDLTIQVKRVH
jgi:hypothetical protein